MIYYTFIYYHVHTLFLTLFLYTTSINSSNFNILSYERQALYDLYNSTNGDDWIYQEGNKGHWDFKDPNVNPCFSNHMWQGLNCTIISSASSGYSYYYISKIMLSSYSLNGEIPYSIGIFSYLQYLNLSKNNIYSKIPNTIDNLSKLIELDLSYNLLSGTLPNSIYNLSALQILNLDSTYSLHGTLSNLVGKLSQLRWFSLRYNQFEGTIPYSIGNLTDLEYLRLSANHFSGKIPDSIGSLTYLKSISLATNHLTGDIPYSLSKLSYLVYCFMFSNQLTGTLPCFLTDLKSLRQITLGRNQFVGSIPDCYGNFKALSIFEVTENNLFGSIPSSLSNLKSLNYLVLGRNQLTGMVPDWIDQLQDLSYLSLSENIFTGTIPFSLSYLIHLQQLLFNDNLLIGNIPDVFTNLIYLGTIDFRYNIFTGTLPSSLSHITLLRRCFLQNNNLSGKLDNVFNGNYQKKLNIIQLSNNQFTGTLPEQIFQSGSLVSFSAVSNCFHGTIPSNICSNTELETLALDGLVCAYSCRNKILPSISSAYISDNQIKGGIPKCLWTMPKLQVLHLSGNGLTGSLPSEMELSNSLIDLSLSYNLLTGSIPNYVQEKQWYNLDLSHNRISGILRSNYARQSNNASLSLKNNRISGTISNHLQTMRNISILEGNAYDCSYDRSDLPRSDANKDTYECGSNMFNILYYLWLGLVIIIIVSVILAWYLRDQINQYLQVTTMAQQIWKWIHIIEYMKVYYEIESDSSQTIMSYFKRYYSILNVISNFSLYCTVIIIVVLLPIYAVVSSYYTTHRYEYAWTISILYLSGKMAFGIIMIVLIVFIILQICSFRYNIQLSKYYNVIDAIEQLVAKRDLDTRSSIWKLYSMYILYISINFIIVGGVNIAYVYIILYQSNNLIILSQILLSIFKMVWNSVVSPKVVRIIIHYLSITNRNNQVFQRRLFVLQFVVSLFNNIITPCLIVAIVSPNCFYHVFEQESDVISSFTYQDCVNNDIDKGCIYGPITSSSTYSPPFTYSYQCSADFVTYYASVFVLVCIISTFIIPLGQLFALKLSFKYNWLSHYIKLYQILNMNNNYATSTSSTTSHLLAIDDIYEIIVSLLTMVGFLVTFGTVFPPLAVALLIAIYRRIYFHKAILGRYISYAMECKSYSCLDIINEDCKVIPLLSTIQLCGWILLYTSCMFYTLFLFDILGDDVGVEKAYWVLIVIPCIPICLHVSYKIYKLYLTYNASKDENSNYVDSINCNTNNSNNNSNNNNNNSNNNNNNSNNNNSYNNNNNSYNNNSNNNNNSYNNSSSSSNKGIELSSPTSRISSDMISNPLFINNKNTNIHDNNNIVDFFIENRK